MRVLVFESITGGKRVAFGETKLTLSKESRLATVGVGRRGWDFG